MKKSMQQSAATPKGARAAVNDPAYKRLADHRLPLPEDVVARCADTDSSHGFRTQ
ncbi:hypothetical protein ACQEU6_08980 [Spirillospora sp. CA-108201]